MKGDTTMGIKKSLRTRLSMTFGLTVLILIIVLSLVIGQRSIHQVQSEIGESLGDTAQSLGDVVDRYMWGRYGEVKVLSELKALKEPDDLAQVDALINRLKATFPAFSWIGYTDQNGKVLASSDEILKGVDISARPVYMKATKEPFIGDVHDAVLLEKLLPNPTGEPMKFVDISTPIFNDGGEFVGVLATHLSWEWVKEIRATVKDRLNDKENMEFFIISEKTHDVILGPKQMLGKPLNVKSVKLADEKGHGWTLEKWPDGKEYLTGYVMTEGYKQYQGLGWKVLVRQPVDVAYAPAKDLLSYLIVCGIVLAVIGAAVGWFLAGRITRPIQRLTVAADHLRVGDKVDIPYYKGIGEIEILSDSLRSLVEDLTTTETSLEQMENIAKHDPLTGLPNRQAYELYLEKAIEKYKTLTILFLDLDGFKAVNDQYGHHAGDELLIQVASRIKKDIRGEELVSRIGGDEFVLVLTNSEEPIANGRRISERIIARINEPYFIEGDEMSVGASIGGAVWHAGEEPVEDAVRRADGILYEVKRNGKNAVGFSDNG